MSAIGRHIWIVMAPRRTGNGTAAVASRPASQWLPRSMVRILTTPCGSPRDPSVEDGLN
jgi:hypothetical protein